MLKLRRYTKPFLMSILIIVALLFGQAMCELAMPDYMSDIVNIGINAGGIEDGVPEAIRESEYQKLKVFMEEKEQKLFEKHYTLMTPASAKQEAKDDYPALKKENVYLLQDIDADTRTAIKHALSGSETIVMGIEQAVDKIKDKDAMDSKEVSKEQKEMMEMIQKLPKGVDVFMAMQMMPHEKLQEMKKDMNKVMKAMGESTADTANAQYVRNEYKAMGMDVDDSYYYQILSDYVGIPIEGEYQLMQTLSDLAKMRAEYEKVNNAMSQVRLKGYGVVTPERSEIILDEPEVIKHGNKYGVKMRAEAPSINLIKAHIQTEIAPIVGSEQQAEDLIAYIKESARDSDDGIWNTNIFGKSIEQLVQDGIRSKIAAISEESQVKLQDTMQKIVNDSKGGLVCIII